MKIKSIEPTPSPNTMKVILTEELPAGNFLPVKTGVSLHSQKIGNVINALYSFNV
jgi:hypothetical protein